MTYIPKKIHLIFIGKDRDYPPTFHFCIERMKKFHPSWDICIYNEDDANELIDAHFPGLKKWFNSYTHFVQRVDILRYLVVYLFGGFYIDMDIYMYKSLDDLRSFNVVLAEEKTISMEEKAHLNLKHRLRVSNYMFGSIPDHPFWLSLLKAAVKETLRPIKTENDILESTGPGLLTDFYHQYKDDFPEVALLLNQDRMCLSPGHKILSCHFGNFAAHLHQGTWRWGNSENQLKKVQNQDSIPCSENELIDCLNYLTTIEHIDIKEKKPYVLTKTNSEVYSLLKLVGEEILDARQLSGEKVLLYENCAIKEDLLSKDNINILYSDRVDETLEEEYIDSINDYFRICYVPHQCIKDVFIRSGVKIPVNVINMGFKRIPRDFNKRLDFIHFTVGVSVENFHLNQFQDLIQVFKRLVDKIPGLRVKILTGPVSRNHDYGYLKTEEVEIISQTLGSSEQQEWFNNMNCYIFPFLTRFFPVGPFQSMYLAIPTIIKGSRIFDELIHSGFYSVIDAKDSYRDQSELFEPYFAEIEEAILDIYNNYSHHVAKSIEGSFWIEDKWKTETGRIDLLREISNLPYR